MRLLIKLSGEALGGENGEGFDYKAIDEIVKRIIEIHNMGHEIAVVVGGGNFMRGRDSKIMERINADYIGMMATVMNAIALTDSFNRQGSNAKILSGIKMECFEYTNKDLASKELSSGNIIVYGGGIGKPGPSTDTCAGLRAADINADILVKLTNVDGVYDKDPRYNKDAKMYDYVSYDEVISKELKIMDMDGIKACRDNNVKIIVTNMNNENCLLDIVNSKYIGTTIYK